MTRLLVAGVLLLGATFPTSELAGGFHRRSAVAPGTVPVIAAAGDIACSSSVAMSTTCRHRETSDLLVGSGFDAILPLGDLQYPSGSLADFQTYYGPTWGRVKSMTRPVPGNHEYQTLNAAGYFQYFESAAGDPARGFYSFDLGTWHLIALNSNCEAVGGCHLGSDQERWLRADLAAHEQVCTLAYWHHPRFTSGSVHANDVRTGPFWETLMSTARTSSCRHTSTTTSGSRLRRPMGSSTTPAAYTSSS